MKPATPAPAAASSPPAVARQSLVVSGLGLAGLALMVASYFLPMWWVSLTAPNYPPDAFPDGIRILFGFTGVSNGCTTAPKASRLTQETQQEDLGWRTDEGAVDDKAGGHAKPEAALDCMHEMNTINHYVGMHPIGVGAPAERLLAKYIFGVLGVGLLAFALGSKKARVVVLAAGFTGVAGWMLYGLFAAGGLQAHVTEYTTEAGRYFRDAERIAQWGQNLHTAVVVIVVALLAVMVALTLVNAKWEKAQLLLGVLPALLPVFFVGTFAAWLYFFGHNLHPWGAFTVKPFMPTVFGEGKVAQFSTFSYPMAGFGVLVAGSVALVVAVLRRRLELLEGGR
ncbi:MAG: hypothetical protein IAE78_25065 [Myxococcus sp.]|nr:hypothetical protein [Myxococcus sp.]